MAGNRLLEHDSARGPYPTLGRERDDHQGRVHWRSSEDSGDPQAQ